jgi:endonuclease/exonuclease/phosphatase family metal-dependent hydrolase
VKILCWNLGAAYGRWRDEPGLHERAWHWIAALDPDLAFLQETQPPAWARERWEVLTLPHEFWASALVARRESRLRPAVLPAGGVIEREGSYFATAEIDLSSGEHMLVSSVHAAPHAAPGWRHPGYDAASIARASVGEPWCNDVAFAGFRDLVEGRRFLIAGDWNTSRSLDAEGVPATAGQEFFDRAAAAGWVELSIGPDGCEGKSWYGSTNPRSCQLDHIFADAQTAASFRSFRIDPDPVEALGLSDHAPLLVELDLEIAVPAPSELAGPVSTEGGAQ